MKSKEQLIIEHNLAGAEAEERVNTVMTEINDAMRSVLDVRRMLLSYEMQLVDLTVKFKAELEAFSKKLNS